MKDEFIHNKDITLNNYMQNETLIAKQNRKLFGQISDKQNYNDAYNIAAKLFSQNMNKLILQKDNTNL